MKILDKLMFVRIDFSLKLLVLFVYAFFIQSCYNTFHNRSGTRYQHFYHDSVYKYEKFHDLYMGKLDAVAEINNSFGIDFENLPSVQYPQGISHTPVFTEEQYLYYILNSHNPYNRHFDHIDLVSFIEMIRLGLDFINANTNTDIFLQILLPEKLTLNTINIDMIKNKGLNARGISEKINFGVANGHLHDRLYPFQLNSLTEASIWDILKIIEYVYDFKIIIENSNHIIIKFEP
ncbi:MAG: hypothetical protein P5678_23800 [Limnospira sp. PMC 1240.20]|uniref:hypothetical protein n=1 Tax=unclassified Limnospira TaxID=2642885 RepID=UPI0028E0E6CF|nr:MULTISPECIES: hypothetical protein [unclassified Limnospira]MDT9190801.1 hypothetical protein [Limnospira sp. PMC 894.15]MDT9221538.1 hypothetical protein [Limnospira sp. PMC 1240.20]MDT9257192.1 hypothetical protein [Limnospira sp. PMC 1254.20]MDT9282762.1 hypothetical protein [Limnospira sp. PMC 1293.21]MDT9303159.1 hypothetical protein [Limnospira sp. PMC 1281.21]